MMGKDVILRGGKREARTDRLWVRFGSLEASANGTIAVGALVVIVVLLAVFLRQAF